MSDITTSAIANVRYGLDLSALIRSEHARRLAAERSAHAASRNVAGTGRPATSGRTGKRRASPPVARLAARCGVDLHDVAGTGAGGRITTHDVRAAGIITAAVEAAGAVFGDDYWFPGARTCRTPEEAHAHRFAND